MIKIFIVSVDSNAFPYLFYSLFIRAKLILNCAMIRHFNHAVIARILAYCNATFTKVKLLRGVFVTNAVPNVISFTDSHLSLRMGRAALLVSI